MKLLRNYIGVLLLVLAIAAIPDAEGNATTYTVFNVPAMRLNEGITATETSFDLSAPIRNGEKVDYPALSGGIIELRNSRFQEYIYYATGSVNSTTKVVTLYGVVRGYCWNQNTFASCESGRVWAKGTEATLVNDMRLFNFSIKKDLVNIFTGSGGLRSDDTTQPFLFINDVTTAQRDLFSYFGASGDAPIIKNSTTGNLQWYDGTSWLDIATSTGSFANATVSVRGVVQLADTGSLINLTATGSSGASNVLTAIITTATGGLTSDWGKVPILNIDGVLSTDMLATGSPSASTFLRGDGSWSGVPSIYFGSADDDSYSLTATGTLSPSTSKNYSDFTIGTGVTLSSSQDPMIKPLVLNIRGDADIYGHIDLGGQGGDGGSNGTNGMTGATLSNSLTINGGSLGSGGANNCGGGGASLYNRGGGASIGGGVVEPMSQSGADILSIMDYLVATGGGGGGGNNPSGGDGGGAFVMKVSGDLTFGANSTIDISGNVGGGGVGNAGGGGGGGTSAIVVAGSFTDNGAVVTVSGGAANTESNCTSGKGADGKLIVYSIEDGTITEY